MPYINVQIAGTATKEQKAEIVKDMTDLVVRVLNKRAEHVHIVIQEIGAENWGFAGALVSKPKPGEK